MKKLVESMLAKSVQQTSESRKGVFKKVFTWNSRQSLKKYSETVKNVALLTWALKR